MAVKVVMTSASALQEVDALQKLQGAMSEFPGEAHVLHLLDSYTQTDESSGESWTHIVTRWATMTQHHAEHSGLSNDM